MQPLTATQARTLTQEALKEKQKEEDSKIKEYIRRLDIAIQEAARDTKTCVEFHAYWNNEFDDIIKKHYKELGYSIRIVDIHYLFILVRCVYISWHPNRLKRFLEAW